MDLRASILLSPLNSTPLEKNLIMNFNFTIYYDETLFIRTGFVLLLTFRPHRLLQRNLLFKNGEHSCVVKTKFINLGLSGKTPSRDKCKRLTVASLFFCFLIKPNSKKNNQLSNISTGNKASCCICSCNPKCVKFHLILTLNALEKSRP